jgi:DNA-binding Xre family transcriptional regulator
MQVTLKQHLENLATHERVRPREQRREVPSLTALAQSINVSRQMLSLIANGGVQQLDLDVLARVITELHNRGFETQINDLLAYHPPQAAE